MFSEIHRKKVDRVNDEMNSIEVEAGKKIWVYLNFVIDPV